MPWHDTRRSHSSGAGLPTLGGPASLGVLLILGVACEAPTADAPPTHTNCAVAWGELVITELMANPAGPDAGAEWFEIANASDRTVGLGGLGLTAGSAARPRSHRILEDVAPVLAPGAHLAIGNAPLGTVTAGYAWPEMTLPNTGGFIEIHCADQAVDAVVFGPEGIPLPPEGRAVQRCGAARTNPSGPMHPDAPWCPADAGSTPYDALGNRGTPGAPNVPCPLQGHCLDGDTARPIRTPAPGDAAFWEIYPDLPGADDPWAEWVEIRVFRAFDLAGLVLEHATSTGTRTFPIPQSHCLPVDGDSIQVLGGTSDPDRNGGIAGMVAAFPTRGLTLYNSAATLALKTVDGLEIARAAHGAPRAGIAIGLDPSGSTWCDQRSSDHFDGIGTPGLPNDPCPEVP